MRNCLKRNPEGLLVSTNHYNDPGWELEKPTDENSWQSLARRDNLIRLCEKEKGNVDAEKMQQIISVPAADGGALNELTVYQIVAEPESRTMWVRTVSSPQWVKVDLNSFV